MGEETVKVLVRCRPSNAREKGLNCKTIVSMDGSIGQVSLEKPGSDDAPKTFSFDGVYDRDSCTKNIYEDLVFPLVEGVLEGYNGTVFAYGQTGCGKSFSMEGIPDPPEHRGITPRSFEHVFQEVAVRSNMKFLVRVSYLEIYNESIRDLLSKDPLVGLELKEHPDRGVFVKDLSMTIVKNADEVVRLMAKGTGNRAVGATAMNADSSRSHSIFTVYLEMCESSGGEDHIRAGKLNLVDLAGSERQSKTQATGDRLKEATKINLSLSALGNVISALVDGKAKHIPYRDSKLTRLLQDSLGGNTKTLMVACVSPADNNYDETLSTLRYANRAKNIKNKAVINEDPKDALLREYQQEIQRLKEMLMGKLPLDPNAIAGTAAAASAPPKVIEKIVTKEVIVEKRVTVSSKEHGKEAAREAAREADAAIAKVRKEKAAEMERMETELKMKYDGQLAELERLYSEQKMTNEKLEEEFELLNKQYEEARTVLSTENRRSLETELAAIPVPQPTGRVTSASSSDSGGGRRNNGTPPNAAPTFAYAVVNESGAVVPAIIGEDGIPVEAEMTASGHVVAVKDEDGNTRVVLGPDGHPAPQVIVIDEPVAVVGPNGDAVLAVRDEHGQAVMAQMGSDGLLRPKIRVDGHYDAIIGPDGRPAREIAMPRGRSGRATPRYKPVAVVGPDGKPTLAVLENGVAVRAEMASDGLLVPSKGPDSKSIAIQGPNGETPKKVKAAVAAVACYAPDGSAVVGAAGTNGTLIRTEMREDGNLHPVVGPDGQPEIVEDVVIPVPPPPAQDVTVLAVEDEVFDASSSRGRDAPAARRDAVDDEVFETGAQGSNSRKTSPPTASANHLAVDAAGASGERTRSAVVRQLQSKLMELEGRVVAGGELANNADLKNNLDRKRRKAREKEELQRLRAAKAGDDDQVLEVIYGSMQDELRAKNKKLAKQTEKLKAAKAEIADLQAEFERERDDLLETVRKQEQQLKLHQQILERVQPLIRRDCNYSNLDRIMTQAQWNEERGEWLLPKVQGGAAAGSSAATSGAGAAGGPVRNGGEGPNSPKMGRTSLSMAIDRTMPPEDDPYRDHLRNNAVGSTYFQPKRAAQLLDSLEQRQREATLQQEQLLSRFDNMRPIASNRSMQLLQQDPYASLEQSPKNRRRPDHEPGGVPLGLAATSRGRKLRPGQT